MVRLLHLTIQARGTRHRPQQTVYTKKSGLALLILSFEFIIIHNGLAAN